MPRKPKLTYKRLENPKYAWVETAQFQRWLISKGAIICHDLERVGRTWWALLDGPWFTPRWEKIPAEACPQNIQKMKGEG